MRGASYYTAHCTALTAYARRSFAEERLWLSILPPAVTQARLATVVVKPSWFARISLPSGSSPTYDYRLARI